LFVLVQFLLRLKGRVLAGMTVSAVRLLASA